MKSILRLKKIFLVIIILQPLVSFSQRQCIYDSSHLNKGNGKASILNDKGENSGVASFKNYNLDGEYYLIDTLKETALKGILRNKPNCVSSPPARLWVKFAMGNDTMSMFLDSAAFKDMIQVGGASVIESHPDSLPTTTSYLNPQLDLVFDNQATVATGIWQQVNLKTNKVITEYSFDECGIAVTVKDFNPDGTIKNTINMPPASKTKKNWHY